MTSVIHILTEIDCVYCIWIGCFSVIEITVISGRFMQTL